MSPVPVRGAEEVGVEGVLQRRDVLPAGGAVQLDGRCRQRGGAQQFQAEGGQGVVGRGADRLVAGLHARAAPNVLIPWPLSSLGRRSGHEAGTPSISAREEVIRMPLPDWRTFRCCIPAVEWNAVTNHSVGGRPLSPRGRRAASSPTPRQLMVMEKAAGDPVPDGRAGRAAFNPGEVWLEGPVLVAGLGGDMTGAGRGGAEGVGLGVAGVTCAVDRW
jgi:hypothetical protein